MYPSSSDSETDEELSKECQELDLMLIEPEEPVKRRIKQIRKSRKNAEENRVCKKRQREAEMITAITVELDEMSFMLHDMGKWV